MLQTCYEEEFILGRMIEQIDNEERRERRDQEISRRSAWQLERSVRSFSELSVAVEE